jgi:hypothetical protein
MLCNQQIDWTDEKIAELREMAKTMTPSQIGRKWGVTRNTICGKMDRLGIRRLGLRIRRPMVSKPKPLHIAPVPRLVTLPHNQDDGDGGYPASAPVSRQAPTEATHKSFREPVDIWHLTASACRFPLWHDSEPISQKLYCGDKALEGLPYCPCHAKVCFSTRAA